MSAEDAAESSVINHDDGHQGGLAEPGRNVSTPIITVIPMQNNNSKMARFIISPPLSQ